MRNTLLKRLREGGKCLVKKFKQEFSKAKKKASGSGTKDIYQPSWEMYAQLQFIDSICDDTAETVDALTVPFEAKSRKTSRLIQRNERKGEKLDLFARAVNAIQTPQTFFWGTYVAGPLRFEWL